MENGEWKIDAMIYHVSPFLYYDEGIPHLMSGIRWLPHNVKSNTFWAHTVRPCGKVCW